MSNLIVFPPSLLLVFLFRKSRPSKLRKSRIQEALSRASKNSSVRNSQQTPAEETNKENTPQNQENVEIQSKKTYFFIMKLWIDL